MLLKEGDGLDCWWAQSLSVEVTLKCADLARSVSPQLSQQSLRQFR